MTRLSIRAQVVLLVGLLLLAAMALYLTLATRIVTRDKEATVYDVNALVAGAVSPLGHMRLAFRVQHSTTNSLAS